MIGATANNFQKPEPEPKSFTYLESEPYTVFGFWFPNLGYCTNTFIQQVILPTFRLFDKYC